MVILAVAMLTLTFHDVLRRAPGRAIDTWAYLVHGQALLRGERPPVEELLTTPKPLGTALGALAAVFPPEVGFALLVASIVAALLVGAFVVGWRVGGGYGAVVTVAAVSATANLVTVLNAALIDVVTPACLVMATIATGRVRLGWVMVAGLLHPFVWPITAFVAWSNARERGLPIRVLSATTTAVSNALAWLALDAAILGDPLATPRWMADFRRALVGSPGPDIDSGAAAFGDALELIFVSSPAIAAVWVVGTIGLFLWARAGGDDNPAESFPLAALVLWTGMLMLYAYLGAPLHPRYLLPSIIVLCLGCGVAAGRLLTSAPRIPSLAAVVAAAVLVAAVLWTVELDDVRIASARRHERILETRPAIHAGLDCGRVGFAGNRYTAGIAGEIAATMRLPMQRFGTIPTDPQEGRLIDPERYAAIFRLHGVAGPLPWTPRYRAPLGRLAYAPDCPPARGLEVFEPG